MKTIGIVFARSDSSRFPQKALQQFMGVPLVVHVLRRASLSKKLQSTVLATTTRATDDALASVVESYGYSVFRGNFEDVAKRAVDCAQFFNADYFVRLNGDSPVIDVELLDAGINRIEKENADFVTNLIPERTYPYGVSVEIIRTNFFAALCKTKRTSAEKEHITKMLYDAPCNFTLVSMPACKYHCCSALLTIDTVEDYVRISNIYSEILADNNTLNYHKIYEKISYDAI